MRGLRRPRRLVSHGEFLPIHLGSLPFSVRFAIDAFADEGLVPGDAVLLNDPYRGGSHLPDVTIVSPIFAADASSASPPTAPTTSTSAARSPAASTPRRRRTTRRACASRRSSSFKAGELDERLLDPCSSNCRLPQQMRAGPAEPGLGQPHGDQRACPSSSTATALDTVRRRVELILDDSERRMRDVIAHLARRRLHGVGLRSTTTGSPTAQREIRVTVRVRGDEAEVDFTGTAPRPRARSTACSATPTPAST